MGVFSVLLAISMIFPLIVGCSLLQQEARHKLEHMGMEILTQCEYDKKEECGPNSEISRGLSCRARSGISDRLGEHEIQLPRQAHLFLAHKDSLCHVPIFHATRKWKKSGIFSNILIK